MSKKDAGAVAYIRKTYPVGWIRTNESLTNEEYEKILKCQRHLLDRSMKQAG